MKTNGGTLSSALNWFLDHVTRTRLCLFTNSPFRTTIQIDRTRSSLNLKKEHKLGYNTCQQQWEVERRTMAVPEVIKKISEAVWEIPVTYKPGMRVPARIYATEKLLRAMDDGVFA